MASPLYNRPARSWTRLVDLAMSEEDHADMVMPMPMSERAIYPWGLRICLTDVELAKLKLDTDCEVGDCIDIRAFGEVTGISKDSGENGSHCRIEIQLQKLALENEMTEDMGNMGSAEETNE